MSPVLTKILIAIGGVVAFGALVLIIYNQQQLKTQQLAIQTQVVQQQQLLDGIVRSQSQWTTKEDLNNFANANNINLKAIQDNLSQLGSQLTSINVATASSNGQVANNLPSSGTGTSNPKPPTPTVGTCPDGSKVNCPSADPFGYQQKEQDFALNEDFGTIKVPFGTVGFSAWQQDPWNVSIPTREYNVDTIIGVDDHERQSVYNKFTVKVKDKNYDVPIKTSTTKQIYPTATWSWWNPRLLLGVDGGVNINHVQGEFTPNVNLGIMSYGQYKTNPDFSILELGAGYGAINKTPGLVITPVSYNLGRNLFAPLMNNLYVGPSVTVNTDGSIGAGLGVRVGL